VFSAAIEVVLTIAYREAVSRRHAYVTLEHLLYALAHDNDGERILAACGADLPRLRIQPPARAFSLQIQIGDAAARRFELLNYGKNASHVDGVPVSDFAVLVHGSRVQFGTVALSFHVV